MAQPRNLKNIRKFRFDEENNSTVTSVEQINVEENCEELLYKTGLASEIEPDLPFLNREQHLEFLNNSLRYLPKGYEVLDSSQPWLCYWILHSLHLLESPPSPQIASALVARLAKCQSPSGGFAGGPGQSAHLAPTYAAVNALCTIGTEEAMSVINRERLQEFLYSLKNADSSFSMHHGSEADIRGVYCALSVARLTNIYTEQLFAGSAEWIVRCQTYEGGFAGVPGMEAHGGYAFCGLAALYLMGKEDLINLPTFIRWVVMRQMKLEGGFQGRTNKLVDGCYSFWQGGAFPLINQILLSKAEDIKPTSLLFHQEALQEYLLICCQHPKGGIIDKPGKSQDLYHTCYGLSGISVAQFGFDPNNPIVVGPPENKLVPCHPLYNITCKSAEKAANYFHSLAVPNFRP
ncbi:protein farnesyltransferase subunit beta [Neocloeon triangulifer]|uniref:protein farnesyltransferase subunit beta n=1 Tax=Neocloeon triangulifer TaxID=2078957 RepID=UPI00286EBC00|nr:protein farnesyltransferase subunit beta [Neocloeon triangulifer]